MRHGLWLGLVDLVVPFLACAGSLSVLTACDCIFLYVATELGLRRPVVDGEQNGLGLMPVLVVVPRPRRHREDVPLTPLDPLALDDDCASAFEAVVEGVAVVSMA